MTLEQPGDRRRALGGPPRKRAVGGTALAKASIYFSGHVFTFLDSIIRPLSVVLHTLNTHSYWVQISPL